MRIEIFGSAHDGELLARAIGGMGPRDAAGIGGHPETGIGDTTFMRA
jgi:hypothetical protein